MNKNWKAICGIPDTHMMWAVALIATESDFGSMIMMRLPEFFTEETQQGPYPLSILREDAERAAIAQCCEPDRGPYTNELYSYGTCAKFDIPTKLFRCRGSTMIDENDPKCSPLPADLHMLVKNLEGIGHIITWKEKDVVVVENCPGEFIVVAPAEMIDTAR